MTKLGMGEGGEEVKGEGKGQIGNEEKMGIGDKDMEQSQAREKGERKGKE